MLDGEYTKDTRSTSPVSRVTNLQRPLPNETPLAVAHNTPHPIKNISNRNHPGRITQCWTTTTPPRRRMASLLAAFSQHKVKPWFVCICFLVRICVASAPPMQLPYPPRHPVTASPADP